MSDRPKTIEERLRFVKEIVILPRVAPRRGSPFIAKENAPGAAVSDGSSLSFVAGLTAQMQVSIMLFA